MLNHQRLIFQKKILILNINNENEKNLPPRHRSSLTEHNMGSNSWNP